MEKRIELEKRGRDPAEIKELNLDNCKSTNIVGLTDEFVNLEVLSLINAGLTSLKGFPKLPNLKKLEASDNRISNGLQILSSSPKLTYLNLSGNKIKDLETLQPLKEFKNLKKLDLYNNEATSIENYRQKVFGLISSLQYLDGYDIHDREDEDSEPEDDEVNGNEDDSDDEISSDTTDDGMGIDDDDDEEEMGLQVVYNDNLEDDSDEGDYEAVEEEEDDELVEEEEEDDEDIQDGAEDGENETPAARGKKRKHEDGDGN